MTFLKRLEEGKPSNHTSKLTQDQMDKEILGDRVGLYKFDIQTTHAHIKCI